MRFALINTESGLVENVIELDADSDWVVPDRCEIVESDTASPGWMYSDGELRPGPEV